jgi:Fe-S-cluster-containing dehydrogenase component
MRQVLALPGGHQLEEKILERILDGHGRPSDLDLLLDIGDNISPGPYPVAAHGAAALDAVPFPPRQTTICPLGPSSVAPITSALRRFRSEFEAKITRRDGIPSSRPRSPTGLRHERRRAVHGDNRRRSHRRGEPRRAADRRLRTHRHLHPEVLPPPRMQPVGMCRACLVEVDTGRGPALQASCMLECSAGMQVDTESERTRKAQDGVLEFLLVNHPLDCPVCDKGGECPLQDQTVAFGPGESRFVEEKRHFEKPIPVNENVFLDRERCILCDRCTRFASEVAGDALIHFQGRGSGTEVNTFPDEPFSSTSAATPFRSALSVH